MSNFQWDLHTADNKIFPVREEVVRKWKTVTDMIEMLSDDTDNEIPLLSVKSSELKKIIKWSQDTLGKIPPPNQVSEVVTVHLLEEDERHFGRLDITELAEIINAANYLAIDRLIDVGTQLLANRIRELEPEEIRRLLNVENDFSEEDDAALREEYELLAGVL